MFSAFRQLINELPMQRAFHPMQVRGTRPRPREKGARDVEHWARDEMRGETKPVRPDLRNCDSFLPALAQRVFPYNGSGCHGYYPPGPAEDDVEWKLSDAFYHQIAAAHSPNLMRSASPAAESTKRQSLNFPF